MKRIGIIGGLGPESTMSYYKHITREYHRRFSDYAYPEIIIYSLSFEQFIDIGYQASARIKDVINNLYKAGADFVIAACNSIHIVYDEVSGDIPIPWLSIIDATAEEMKKSGINKAGLLGTIFTMRGDFYRRGLSCHGINTIVPDADEQDILNRIIYEELVVNQIKEGSRDDVLRIINALSGKGVDGIILGCTELPLLIREKDTNVKLFDTTLIHARKALEFALE